MVPRKCKLALFFILLFGILFFPKTSNALNTSEQEPVVRAVLFYSPTCGYCHKVITEELPPLFDKYGDQLQIIGINVATEEGGLLYLAYIEKWQVPDERRGVPALVIDDKYLVGAGEIPQQFPGIIENGLESGGIDWPEIQGLIELIERIEIESNAQETAEESQSNQTTTPETITENPPTATPDETLGQVTETLGPTAIPSNTPGSSESLPGTPAAESSVNLTIPFDDEFTVVDRFKHDLAGNILAVVVLVGMVIVVIWVLINVIRTPPSSGADWSWVIPILSILGLIVASYLSFVEVTETEAVCGPVGDCNTVQQSPYATLLGFLPVGVLGLIGYIAILLGWILKRYSPDQWKNTLAILIWAMALFGVIFSIYLTFLEPFVIGATCLWCITSAVIITIQFWAASEPVRQIWMESDDVLED
jgi:uncharacterized membrane protein